MTKHFFSGIVGLILGIVITYFSKYNRPDYVYYQLSEDVTIGELGNLKKGTLLRYDESYSEGFTRFILYLNVKGLDLEKYDTNSEVIIPYWLEKEKE